MSRICIYVDGESHFHRSAAYLKSRGVKLDDLLAPEMQRTNSVAQEFPPVSNRFLLNHESCFFWDNEILGWFGVLEGGQQPLRAVYFSSFSGDEDGLHRARTEFRSAHFEPVIVHERRTKANNRANLLEQNNVIEKAKGVDIELAVRVLEDAHSGVFDECCLFTCDEDYIPLIQAVRRTGKLVYVFGYKSLLANRSQFESIPDRFFNLELLTVDK
jgi:hypothetical protein